MKGWNVISLRIPKEYLEIVSNVLMEQGASGIEEIEENKNLNLLRAYFPDEGGIERVVKALKKYLKSLKGIFPQFPSIDIQTQFLKEQDWSEEWKRYFKPIRVGSKLLILPPWIKIRPKRGEIPILITPGMGFGTGTHSTTKLCIKALMKRLKEKGGSVLDVGTGSGILSIVAARLGAGEVWGIDIDEEALELARKNVEQNHLAEVIHIRKGSIGRIRKEFDLIVANIDLKTLWRLRNPIERRLKPGGFLILSGILQEDEQKLCDHYLKSGALNYIETRKDKEWVCLTFQRG